MTRFLAAIFLILTLCSPESTGQDWPALRGSHGDGTITTGNGILGRTSGVKFKTRWKTELGSGYSSVVVAGSRLVTMYTDGSDDLVVCLDANDGKMLWQMKTNPMFKGENGSFDGPLSTPVIHQGKVYVLTAVGRLICFSLNNGNEIWSRDIPKETGVARPHYGFVTSPVMARVSKQGSSQRGLQIGSQSILIVNVGAAKKQVVGFDAVTGKTLWSAGNDTTKSQTPVLAKIAGNEMLLVCGDEHLIGLDPANGRKRFEIEHQGTNAQATMPVSIGNDRVLLTLDDRFSSAFQLTQTGNARESVSEADADYEATEIWKERTIKNTYNIPVQVGDGVFAYSTRILTCVDPATGKAFWKTRNPGDGFLIAVDGHLVISTKTGSLHLAKASTAGFEELAELQLFDDLVWSVPAFSDDSVFVRSLGEIARVDLIASESENGIANAGPPPMSDGFKSFLEEIQNADSDESKTEVVDRWVDQQEQFPVIENNIAHFIYRGESPDVALAGDFFGARQEKKMISVSGTDLFYYSVKLHPEVRTNYCFLIDFQPTPDPLNQRRTKSTLYAGEMEFALRLKDDEPLEMSWFGMPEWKPPFYFDDQSEVQIQKGRLVERTINVPESVEGESLTIYLPPGYDPLKQRQYPVAYFLDGAQARIAGQVVEACDRLFSIDDKLSSIVVFLEGRGPRLHKLLEEEIVPLVDEDFKTIADRKARMIVGCGFSSGEALVMSAIKNKIIGNVSSQSPLVFAAEEQAIYSTMEKVELPMNVHIQWGMWDIFNPHENWDVRDEGKRIATKLTENKQLTVLGGMVNDSTDWSSWKNRYEDIFGLLRE